MDILSLEISRLLFSNTKLLISAAQSDAPLGGCYNVDVRQQFPSDSLLPHCIGKVEPPIRPTSTHEHDAVLNGAASVVTPQGWDCFIELRCISFLLVIYCRNISKVQVLVAMPIAAETKPVAVRVCENTFIPSTN
ncbi:hypothetical protein Tco_1496330, partial [Tanacetum coccineum]